MPHLCHWVLSLAQASPRKISSKSPSAHRHLHLLSKGQLKPNMAKQNLRSSPSIFKLLRSKLSAWFLFPAHPTCICQFVVSVLPPQIPPKSDCGQKALSELAIVMEGTTGQSLQSTGHRSLWSHSSQVLPDLAALFAHLLSFRLRFVYPVVREKKKKSKCHKFERQRMAIEEP